MIHTIIDQDVLLLLLLLLQPAAAATDFRLAA